MTWTSLEVLCFRFLHQLFFLSWCPVRYKNSCFSVIGVGSCNWWQSKWVKWNINSGTQSGCCTGHVELQSINITRQTGSRRSLVAWLLCRSIKAALRIPPSNNSWGHRLLPAFSLLWKSFRPSRLPRNYYSLVVLSPVYMYMNRVSNIVYLLETIGK